MALPPPEGLPVLLYQIADSRVFGQRQSAWWLPFLALALHPRQTEVGGEKTCTIAGLRWAAYSLDEGTDHQQKRADLQQSLWAEVRSVNRVATFFQAQRHAAALGHASLACLLDIPSAGKVEPPNSTSSQFNILTQYTAIRRSVCQEVVGSTLTCNAPSLLSIL